MPHQRPEKGASSKISRVTPLPPEAAASGLGGFFDHQTGELSVPLEDADLARALRLHEIWHSRVSPKPQDYTRDPKTRMMIEDIRIHAIARRVLPEEISSQLEILEQASLADVETMLARPEKTPEDILFTVLARLRGTQGHWDHEITPLLDKLAVPPFVQSAAGHLWRMIQGEQNAQWQKARRHEARPVVKPSTKLKQLIKQFEDCFLPPPPPTPGPRPPTTKGNGQFKQKDGDGGWGKMKIVELPKPLRSNKAWELRATTNPSLQGWVPGFMERFCLDRRIFTRTVRQESAMTILLDASGSMSLETEDIARLLEATAGKEVLIAYYSGRFDEGDLCIAARGGYYAQHLPTDGGNIIDGPALRWLAKQPGQRIWISDGQVTGTGESQHGALLADVAQVVWQGNIQQHLTIDKFLESLNKQAR